MKKFLVLMLVLGIASAANATLALSYDGGPNPGEVTVTVSTVFVIDVHSPINVVDQFWVGITGPADYTGYGTVVSPPAPSTMVVDDGGYGAGWIHAYMPEPSTSADVGEWWWLELHCSGEGDVVVDLYDSTGNIIIDTMTIHQIIPEPMTIALLGLGGLLLRRRK